MSNINFDIEDSMLLIISYLAKGDLSKTDIKVLNQILFTAKYVYEKKLSNESFKIDQTSISEALKMQQPNVSRSLKKLLNLGVIETCGVHDKQYRFNYVH